MPEILSIPEKPAPLRSPHIRELKQAVKKVRVHHDIASLAVRFPILLGVVGGVSIHPKQRQYNLQSQAKQVGAPHQKQLPGKALRYH